MPVLPNPKHERFAQELAKGATADAAYVIAGYKESRHNASTLRTNQNILDRIIEIQSRVAQRVEVTVESLIAEAEEVRALAIESGQLNAAIAAIKEKGVLSGRREEKVRVKHDDERGLSDGELSHIARSGRDGASAAAKDSRQLN